MRSRCCQPNVQTSITMALNISSPAEPDDPSRVWEGFEMILWSLNLLSCYKLDVFEKCHIAGLYGSHMEYIMSCIRAESAN